MRGDVHVGCGAGETHREQSRQGAPVRPNRCCVSRIRVHMLAELSLEPECRRGHGAVYDAVNHGEVQVARLRRALAALALPAWDDGRIRLAADVSNWLRRKFPLVMPVIAATASLVVKSDVSPRPRSRACRCTGGLRELWGYLSSASRRSRGRPRSGW